MRASLALQPHGTGFGARRCLGQKLSRWGRFPAGPADHLTLLTPVQVDGRIKFVTEGSVRSGNSLQGQTLRNQPRGAAPFAATACHAAGGKPLLSLRPRRVPLTCPATPDARLWVWENCARKDRYSVVGCVTPRCLWEPSQMCCFSRQTNTTGHLPKVHARCRIPATGAPGPSEGSPDHAAVTRS